MNNPFSFIIGPRGETHVGIGAPGMTLVDGKLYCHAGQNFTVGPNGKSYVQSGNVVFGSDGSTHVVFGDNPKIVL